MILNYTSSPLYLKQNMLSTVQLNEILNMKIFAKYPAHNKSTIKVNITTVTIITVTLLLSNRFYPPSKDGVRCANGLYLFNHLVSRN